MELCYRTSHQSYKSFTSACEPGGFEALKPADFGGGFKRLIQNFQLRKLSLHFHMNLTDAYWRTITSLSFVILDNRHEITCEQLSWFLFCLWKTISSGYNTGRQDIKRPLVFALSAVQSIMLFFSLKNSRSAAKVLVRLKYNSTLSSRLKTEHYNFSFWFKRWGQLNLRTEKQYNPLC